MKAGRRSREVCSGSIRVLVAGTLCVLMMVQLVPAGASMRKPVKDMARPIEGSARVLHVLNRFTFGARADDVAAVQAMGARRWFELQLNPAKIDDSGLEARLAMFPAMNMNQVELLERYPSPQVLRQMLARNLPLPADPVEHAIYADQIAFSKMAKAKREAEQAKETAAAQGGGADGGAIPGGPHRSDAALPGDGVDPANPAMAAHEEQFYSGLEGVKVVNLPPDQRMRRILTMAPEELISFRRSLSQGELAALVAGLAPIQRETLAALENSTRMIDAELLEARMMRDIYSERQLEAVMTDFWLNHFNVYARKNQQEPYFLPAYERDVVRPRALGRFEDLLIATAQSPAMLMYLDNWQSIGPDSQAAQNGVRAVLDGSGTKALKDRGLNENYARELMELHTLGVGCEVSEDHPVSALDKSCGRGYTQQDVTEVAKVLTGWTIDQPNRAAAYRFEERRHEPGTKKVLGRKISEHGEAEGLQVLHMLATSPATAKFISTKLAVRFVSDTPPSALVDRMTKAFLSSGGDIKTVLRAMFDSPEFWSVEVYRAKVKTPEEYVVSAVRASGAEVTGVLGLVQSLNKLGMPFYGMQTPNGYSWMAEPWVNTGDLVSRMNFALNLSGNRIPGVATDWTKALAGQTGGVERMGLGAEVGAEGAAEKERRLETILLGQPASEQTRSSVLQQIGNEQLQREAIRNFPIRTGQAEPMAEVLNAGVPKQQVALTVDRQAAAMAGLLLGSPEFQRR